MLADKIVTVYPQIVHVRSINFTVCVMRGQFKGALYLRVWFNSTDHAAKPRHIIKLDRLISMSLACGCGFDKFVFCISCPYLPRPKVGKYAPSPI